MLYAPNLPRKAWFSRYAELFDTVEINNTFYRLPELETFDAWREQAPAGFVYALKFSRYGSHLKRLKTPKETIGRFLDRASRLGSSLGPILAQLPPRWHADPERLDDFLSASPPGFRWAVEFRDPDWLRDEVIDVLEDHGAALCIHDMFDAHPLTLTTDWVYLRFHGARAGGCYSHQFLTAQARRIDGWLGNGLDVFVYFNNDAHGYAVKNALQLQRYLRTVSDCR